MQYLEQVKDILADVLSLGADAKAGLNEQSALLGSIPELDSMAVVGIITAMEEQFGIVVDDDEISASTFETLGTLSAFVEQKLAA
jgi:acyl carrier protein